MPLYGFNKLLIAAGWFAAGFAVALLAALAAWGLPRGDALRALAFVPVLLQTLFALVVLAQVFAA